MQAPISISREEPVGGRYKMAERVGEGNFAVTYRAGDLVLGRTVAVKMLRAQYAADPTFVARFEREARVAASVSHPNVVDVYDFGSYRDTYFIAMQYVPGRTLKDELEARGPLPAAEAVRIAGQILHGLGAIHAAGIVHRDIKPQNVLLGPDRVARVTDFGVAHYPVQGALTTHGTTVGTASYMAPEQARGAGLSEATDLYAVGVVLFELLTGRLPFEGDNPMAVMLAHLQQPPPRPSEVAPAADVPPALEAEVMRALAKDPRQRRPSAGDMADGLDASLADNRHPDARLPWRDDAGTATMQVPVATEARFPTAARGLSVAPTPPAVGVPSTVPAQRLGGASLPPVRSRRRPAAWLAPVALFSAALAALGGVVASGTDLPGFGNADAGPTNVPVVAESDRTETPSVASTASLASTATPSPVPTVVPAPEVLRAVPLPSAGPTSAALPTTTAQPTATPPPTPTATPPPQATATPPPTTVPRATQRPEPTATPARPTATPAPTEPPEPTATSIPRRTDSAESESTAAAEPAEVVLDGGGVVGRPVEDVAPTPAPPPVPVSAADAAAAPSPVPVETGETDPLPTPAPVEQGGDALGFLSGPGVRTFAAREWRGTTNADPATYGKPAVAIYGQRSQSSRATLQFNLEEPLNRMDLYLTGHGDETGTAFQFSMEINGVPSEPMTSPFPAWDGLNPAWGVMRIRLPANLLRAGRNEIAIVSLQPGNHDGLPPYLLLGEASLAPTDATREEAAAAPAESVELSSERSSGQGNAHVPVLGNDPKETSGRNGGSSSNRGRGADGDGDEGVGDG